MNRKVFRNTLLLCFAWLLASTAGAQGNNGRGKCMQPFGISFYLVKGGYEDEWLELYMKWHYPLMEYGLQQGTVVEHKLMVPDGHSQEPQWTFAATFLYPASQDRKSAPLDRAQLIEHLFGDRMDEYAAGEKRRWDLTLKHWDTDFIQLDKSERPLSVYKPSEGGCK
jgi:hypothetical protein